MGLHETSSAGQQVSAEPVYMAYRCHWAATAPCLKEQGLKEQAR